jgi:hypothetical protein
MSVTKTDRYLEIYFYGIKVIIRNYKGWVVITIVILVILLIAFLAIVL